MKMAKGQGKNMCENISSNITGHFKITLSKFLEIHKLEGNLLDIVTFDTKLIFQFF